LRAEECTPLLAGSDSVDIVVISLLLVCDIDEEDDLIESVGCLLTAKK